MVRLPLLVTACLLASAADAGAGTITPDLARRVEALAPGAEIPVIIRMGDPVDLGGYSQGRATAPAMIAALRDQAARSQVGVLQRLRERGRADRARVLWIDNSIAVSVPTDVLAELAALPGVDHIDFDEPVRMADAAPDAIELLNPGWNVTKIRAPDVWSLGYDGTGVLMGSMDTGFDPTHPALAGKWRGGSNSWIDIINGLPSPYDDHGHGTHTIGTMVGGDGAGPQTADIGVAYGAHFISAKVLDATNSFSSSSIVEAGAQWMLDPDGNPATNDYPQIINNSWLYFSTTFTGFYYAAAAWRAAGIIPVFCIANDGPSPSTTHPPGNYDNVLGVGATDMNDVIAPFSSRGPAPAGPDFPADGRKPDLSAPGSAVVSCIPGGGYAAMSGTSMASPHVAATIALMIQAHPGLIYEQARLSLVNTAVDLGAVGYDYDYGYGRIDALAAVLAPTTGVALPGSGKGLAIHPNPFRDAVTLDLAASATSDARIRVFDVQGRCLWSAPAPPTGGTLRWDGRDASGAVAPAGLYFVNVSDGRSRVTLRAVRLR